MDWAVLNKVQRERLQESLDLAQNLIPESQSMTLKEYRQSAQTHLNTMVDLNYYFQQRMQIEPVGMLHLERMSFIPAGIERGELVHSVPLSPGEEVNISHKEWSNTSEEFETHRHRLFRGLQRRRCNRKI